MTRVILDGCTAEPLGSYLKSLAVLRLIAEQKDPNAKGWWEDGTFCIESALDKEGISRFFLKEYMPTPIVAPWNGGSGFYEGDNRTGLDAILKSTSPRFVLYRETIQEIFNWSELPSAGLKVGNLIDELEQNANQKSGKAKEDLLKMVAAARTILDALHPTLISENVAHFTIDELEQKSSDLNKDVSASKKEIISKIRELVNLLKKIRTEVKKTKRSAGKNEIILACRNRLCPEALGWVDAAVIIGSDEKPMWPQILGSGGNEGRFDYTNAFMDNIRQLLIDASKPAEPKELLKNALFGDNVEGYSDLSVGQFDPGRAGGYNQGFGIEQKDFPTNPWNFVLTLEGAIIWSSSIGRRDAVERKGLLKSPFTVKAKAVGYLSTKDEDAARAELWTPLWQRLLGIKELRAFIGEGRSDVGRKRAGNTIEFAEAISSLGVDRGVTEFVRYDLLKRRGDNYIALPAGRFPVTYRRESDLINELDQILQRLDIHLSKTFDKMVPAEFVSARHRIDQAMYEVLLHGGTTKIKYLVAAIGQMEQLLAKGNQTKSASPSHPFFGLSPRWIAAADDGTLEIRIAAALASIKATDDVGSIRTNLEHGDPTKPDQTAWTGNNFSARLASVLTRRMMDAKRLSCTSNPLDAVISLVPEDIASFIEGDTNDNLVQDLLFGLMWIKWSDYKETKEMEIKLRKRWMMPVNERIVQRSWALIKLLFLPHDIRREGYEPVRVKPESSIIPLIRAGRITDACDIARKRLYSSGFLPVKAIFPNTINGERIAAALLIPVRAEKTLMNLVLETDNKKLRG